MLVAWKEKNLRRWVSIAAVNIARKLPLKEGKENTSAFLPPLRQPEKVSGALAVSRRAFLSAGLMPARAAAFSFLISIIRTRGPNVVCRY